MAKKILRILVLILCVSSISMASWAAGSGAFRVELPDAGAAGKGFAFVGQADTASAVYYNPAGMTQIKGSEVIVGATLLQPFTSYTSNSGSETDLKKHSYGVPHFYYVSDLGLDKFAFGVRAGTSWGLVTEWADDSFSKYSATKSELKTQDYALAGAYQITDQWSVSISADYNRANLDKHKKMLQTGGGDGHLNLRMDGDAWGYRLATHYKLSEKHMLGFMYRSKITHKLQGSVELSNLNTSGSNYQTIFGGTTFKTSSELKTTLPQSLIVGYSYMPDEKWTFNFDFEWMDWSTIRDELVTYPDSLSGAQSSVLNTGNPVQHDWDSVYSFAAGFEYKANDRLRLRSGYYYHQSPIPNDTFDSSIPDDNSHGVTVGFGYDLKKDLTLDMAYSALFHDDRIVDNTVGNGFGADLDGEYETWISMLLASVSYRF